MPTQSRGHFSSSRCPASKELRVHRELGGDRTRTADSNPAGCPVTRGVMLNNRIGGAGQGGCHCSSTGWRWAIALHCAPLVLTGFVATVCFSLFFLPPSRPVHIKLPSSLTHRSLCLSIFSLIPQQGGDELMAVWCLPSCQVKWQLFTLTGNTGWYQLQFCRSAHLYFVSDRLLRTQMKKICLMETVRISSKWQFTKFTEQICNSS